MCAGGDDLEVAAVTLHRLALEQLGEVATQGIQMLDSGLSPAE